MAESSNSKASVVSRILAVKQNSGKSFKQIAGETGLTNVYVAQLLRRQAQLHRDTARILRASLPELTEELLAEMMKPPFRSYDPNIIQEPTIYRLNEAVMHFGESIKDIINEEFGDGIMSAIDFYCSVNKVQTTDGKDRVVVTFNGKYLPFPEQKSKDMKDMVTGPKEMATEPKDMKDMVTGPKEMATEPVDMATEPRDMVAEPRD